MTSLCTLCEDIGWVCEDCPSTPWKDEHSAVCGGAGAPCPVCNKPDAAGEVPRLPDGFRTDVDKDGWRH